MMAFFAPNYFTEVEDLRNFKPPLNRDVIEAAKNVIMMDFARLQAELSQEVRAVIVAAWTRGGLLPAAAIRAMVPVVESEATECRTI